MNLLHIIKEIENVDKEVYERLDSRRGALRQFRSFTSKTALASLPFAFGSILKKAYAQSPNTAAVEAVLQFALTLEYLEAEFYSLAIASPGLIPAGASLTALTLIRDQENQHVAFLKAAIESFGKTAVDKPDFDFSGGKGISTGPFADVFTNYDTFLALAQAFEDTGVRAYKGQVPALVGKGSVLTDVLNIHSVEARHASHIRQMRQLRGAAVKPWITGKESGIQAALQLSYEGEESVAQSGIVITDINGLQISAEAASESFDEPLTGEQVLDILDPFIVTG